MFLSPDTLIRHFIPHRIPLSAWYISYSDRDLVPCFHRQPHSILIASRCRRGIYILLRPRSRSRDRDLEAAIVSFTAIDQV